MSEKIPHSPIEPLADRVVIAPDIPDHKTESGFIVPDIAKKPIEDGMILAVGTDIDNLKVGDRVKFEKRTGNLIVLKDVPYLIMKEQSVLGTLT